MEEQLGHVKGPKEPEHNFTIQYYEDHAKEFAANTIGADMEHIRSRFLSYLPKHARILDFGCGTGRDAKAFRDQGYDVSAIDGSEALCRIAAGHAGVPVRCMDFREYSPKSGETYEGIWACASLLHLERCDLLPVIKTLARALQSGGVLYLSFKYGDFEGERNGRYFTDFTFESFEEYIRDLTDIGVAEHWVTGDVRAGRESERWLNMIVRKMITLS